MKYNSRGNWEQGSEFPLMDYHSDKRTRHPWNESCLYMGSGRDAIRLLLDHGIENRGWLRLWIPGYFCQGVVETIQLSGITVMVYNNNPLADDQVWDNLPFEKGDVILVVNFFGLCSQPDYTSIDRQHVEIIEDHTHDPWSDWAWNSQADWGIASLRKTIPVPDGGVLWSPQGWALPSRVKSTFEHRIASLEKLAAMVLKKYYLDELPIDKQTFRNLAMSGEEGIAVGQVSAMTPWTKEMVNTIPVENWREKRIQNYSKLTDVLKTCKWVQTPKEILPGTCPLSVPLLFDKPLRRDHVRTRLIENSVYPAILWDLDNPVIEGVSDQCCDISRRILCIHCDMRYDEQTMEYLGKLISTYADEI